MSRASTMNSTEMEMNIRNNNFMVPSYSDAMLMNAACRASILSGKVCSFMMVFLNSLSTDVKPMSMNIV